MDKLLELQKLKTLETFDYLENSCTSCGSGSCNDPGPTRP